MDYKVKCNNDMPKPIICNCTNNDLEFRQKLEHDYKNEIKDAFETVGIIIRAKISRLCNENKYIEAEELEKALIIINNTDYNH